jgi:hypothetical protein
MNDDNKPNPHTAADLVADAVAEMRTASTAKQLELIGQALLVIADQMRPCEDCGRQAPTIDPADNPATGLDPAQLEAGAKVIDMQTRQALEG